eukprot:11986959-Ditylum_brightwellii.AAC.1
MWSSTRCLCSASCQLSWAQSVLAAILLLYVPGLLGVAVYATPPFLVIYFAVGIAIPKWLLLPFSELWIAAQF